MLGTRQRRQLGAGGSPVLGVCMDVCVCVCGLWIVDCGRAGGGSFSGFKGSVRYCSPKYPRQLVSGG